MEKTKRLVILFVSTLMIAGAIIAADKPPADKPAASAGQPPPSEARTASCLVRITLDPAFMSSDTIDVNNLIHSSGIAGKAAREALGLSPDAADALIATEILSRNLNTARQQPRPMGGGRGAFVPGTVGDNEEVLLFRLRVKLPDGVRPDAEKFMAAVVENFKGAVREVSDGIREKLNTQRQLAQERASRAEDALRTQQAELRKLSGGRPLDRRVIMDDIENKSREIDGLQMEQESNKAYEKAVAAQAEEAQQRLRQQLAEDVITKELVSVVNMRTEQLADTKKLVDAGRASAKDLSEAEEKVTLARIDLAKRQEELAKEAGVSRLSGMTSKLADFAIAAARNEARINVLRGQIDEAQSRLGAADNYQVLSLKVDMALQNLQTALQNRDELENRNRLIQAPMITVLGAGQ